MESALTWVINVVVLGATCTAVFLCGSLSIKVYRLTIRVRDLEALQLRDMNREKSAKRWEKHRDHETQEQALMQELGALKAKNREERYANDPLPL